MTTEENVKQPPCEPGNHDFVSTSLNETYDEPYYRFGSWGPYVDGYYTRHRMRVYTVCKKCGRTPEELK